MQSLSQSFCILASDSRWIMGYLQNQIFCVLNRIYLRIHFLTGFQAQQSSWNEPWIYFENLKMFSIVQGVDVFINLTQQDYYIWPAIQYPITQLLHLYLHRCNNTAPLKIDMPISTCIFFTFNWLTLTSKMHFVKFHPEVASCLLSRGKRKYAPLGMRLLWKYMNYFLIYQ